MHVLDNGLCVTCSPRIVSRSFDSHDHVFDDGECSTCAEVVEAILTAFDELESDSQVRAAWNPEKHPRNPKGSPGGGRFRSLVDRVKDAIEQHAKGKGEGHPLDGFTREQLRQVAKKRGIDIVPREPIESIKKKILDDHGVKVGKPDVPEVKEPDRPHVPTHAVKTVLTGEQLAALTPKRGGWNWQTTRQRAVAALKKTPEGRTLLRMVDSFQSGSGVNIPRVRTDIEKVLAGDSSVPAGRVASVRTLLDAVAQSDAGERPLYRGMVAPMALDDVTAQYKAGGTLDLSLASFSTDRKLAAEFSTVSAGQRVTSKTRTPVVIEWLSGPKHALPVENLSRSGVFADEKEWVGAGRYRIVKTSTRSRNGVTTVVLQVEQVSTW